MGYMTVYEEYLRVLSKIIFFLLQDGYTSTSDFGPGLDLEAPPCPGHLRDHVPDGCPDLRAHAGKRVDAGSSRKMLRYT